MDIRETADKKQVYYSIQFYKTNGEMVTVPRGYTCGLPFNM
jgi:hypothetical protein